ncbi:MAG: hypothetical protein MUC68_12380 [Burkholderiaceae bacterium]|jgi:hypothetical protein|nr:hypothetical protein [Burkholderiaceae bacterium]
MLEALDMLAARASEEALEEARDSLESPDSLEAPDSHVTREAHHLCDTPRASVRTGRAFIAAVVAAAGHDQPSCS